MLLVLLEVYKTKQLNLVLEILCFRPFIGLGIDIGKIALVKKIHIETAIGTKHFQLVQYGIGVKILVLIISKLDVTHPKI